MFSSKIHDWGTPQKLFDELNAEFKFTLDACANETNYKIDNYFTESDNALIQEWNGVIWCNPPYGRQVKEWVRKAYEESKRGNTVVMLIPARTDTAYWHDYVIHGEVRFIRGRLKFENKDRVSIGSAPFPSAIVVFR